MFPFESNFANIGTLSFADVSSVGVQSATITGLTMNVSPFVGVNFAIPGAYTTTLQNVAGSVSLYNGALTAIDLTSTIVFTYTFLGTPYQYAGSFVIDGDTFALHVDQTKTTPAGAARYRWDVTGGVAGLASVPPPVPEPSTYLLLGAGLSLVAVAVRRRNRRS